MEKEKKFVYADYAATSKIKPEVLNKIIPFLENEYGNPSSIYSLGREAKKAIELARMQVVNALNVTNGAIYFTGSGTESDNWAIRQTAYFLKSKGKNHIITTQFEHHAVLHTIQALEKEGFIVTYLPVCVEGYVTANQVEQAINENTALVSVMYANNEIGTIQPIKEIAQVCNNAKVIFHTDAVQAVGNLEIDVTDLNIDLLTLSGHKFGALKGVGALYVKKGTPIFPFIQGGAQEKGKRAGTENTAAIVSLGEALTICVNTLKEKSEKLLKMRNYLIDNILENIPKCRLNGGLGNRLPNNINISFEAVEGESLLLLLDMNGICASSGSACTSGSLDPSHVLISIGLPHEIAHGSLRLTLGDDTSMEDCDYILEVLPKVVKRVRDMSPLWD